MPVDAEPIADGNLLLEHKAAGEPPVAKVIGRERRDQLARELAYRIRAGMHEPGPLRLFVSHFATCPNAARHRSTTS
jgi:hypothetical protein